MAAIRQRNEIGRLFLRRVGSVALFVIVCFGIAGVWSAWHKKQESELLRMQAESAAADLVTEKTNLAANIERLQSERGKEATLRDRYGVGKAGENLIVIVDPTPSPSQVSEQGFLDRVKRVFSWW